MASISMEENGTENKGFSKKMVDVEADLLDIVFLGDTVGDAAGSFHKNDDINQRYWLRVVQRSE